MQPTAAFSREGSGSMLDSAEKIWTPQITFDTPGDVSVDYEVQEGEYTRIGDRVFVVYHLKFTPGYSNAAGVMRITGLPYTVCSTGLGVFFTGAHNGALLLPFPVGVTSLMTLATPTFNALHVQGNGPSGAAGLVTVNQVNPGAKRYIRGECSYLTDDPF